MRFQWLAVATVTVIGGIAAAQMPAGMASSHSSTLKSPSSAQQKAPLTNEAMAHKTAIRVNGTAISELEVRREMITIFPYALQHNGFPKELEPEIHRGAVEMIIFEELLYQDARRRNIDVASDRMSRAESEFKKQFKTQAAFDQYLKAECGGSEKVLHEKIRRSLLIEKQLKSEVAEKSSVTPAMVREYYDKNPKEFQHEESVEIQTISILPPQGASQKTIDDARKKAAEIAKKAKETKTYEQFGLLAEQNSDDDWRTNMGDRHSMELKTLPPMIAVAVLKLKVGEVSDLIEVGNARVIVRLNGHTSANKTPFDKVEKTLTVKLQKEKALEVRAALNQRLKKDAKVEVL